MGEVFVKEKEDPRHYIMDLAKRYNVEKLFEKSSTHIFMKKESEYKSVNRIIQRFESKSYAEFDTLFKLYKLQKFCINVNYFKGSQYGYQTLINLKSIIRSCTLDSSIDSKNTTRNLINSFVREIKDVSQPFSSSLVDGKRKQISALVSSGSLSLEDIEFINSEIKPRYIKKKKRERIQNQFALIDKEKQMKKVKTSSTVAERYEILAKHYKEGNEVLRKLLPEMNKKSLTTYVSYLKRFDKGVEIACDYPASLYKAWSKFKDRPCEQLTNLSDNEKERKSSSLKDNYEIIIENYKKGISALMELLPNQSYKTLTNYISHLNRLDRGAKEKPKAMPVALYNLYLNAKKTETPVLTNYISKSTNKEFILYDDTRGIVASGSSKDYLKGFRDASGINSLKIYQLVD